MHLTCSTWSTVTPRSGGDGWPTDHSSSSVANPNANPSTLNDDQSGKPGASVNINATDSWPSDSWPSDLVPEFEPGKPWKGTQILKSVEDDPTLTPGSVSCKYRRRSAIARLYEATLYER